ncbi:MAG: hypothetical protein J4431_03410 [Candidatus Aenigmarchaeota archaeon]|nr:hypothetical protein [Candidatus Aenigmarchaeota archaeon]
MKLIAAMLLLVLLIQEEVSGGMNVGIPVEQSPETPDNGMDSGILPLATTLLIAAAAVAIRIKNPANQPKK